MLLVLDNCEHLVTACAQLAETILGQCTDVQILATSREILGISSEMARLVPSLSLPVEEVVLSPETLLQWEGIRLFMERASAARADFSATAVNLSAIAQVCRKLDGMPLAIELAAVRVRMLSVEQIAARLDDRFHLLTGGSRTALPHQQTLRATIDWSYELLPEAERILFGRLSVFAGGWALDAAEKVCSDINFPVDRVVDVLEQLVSKSLVVAEAQSGSDGEMRYWMLDTIHEYAREKFQESGDVHRMGKSHFDCFLRMAQEAEQRLQGSEQSEWLPAWGTGSTRPPIRRRGPQAVP